MSDQVRAEWLRRNIHLIPIIGKKTQSNFNKTVIDGGLLMCQDGRMGIWALVKGPRNNPQSACWRTGDLNLFCLENHLYGVPFQKKWYWSEMHPDRKSLSKKYWGSYAFSSIFAFTEIWDLGPISCKSIFETMGWKYNPAQPVANRLLDFHDSIKKGKKTGVTGTEQRKTLLAGFPQIFTKELLDRLPAPVSPITKLEKPVINLKKLPVPKIKKRTFKNPMTENDSNSVDMTKVDHKKKKPGKIYGLIDDGNYHKFGKTDQPGEVDRVRDHLPFTFGCDAKKLDQKYPGHILFVTKTPDYHNAEDHILREITRKYGPPVIGKEKWNLTKSQGEEACQIAQDILKLYE